MITSFVVVAWLIALGSWLAVSQATAGVAGICFACFLIISARVVQAGQHHKHLLQALDRLDARQGGRVLPDVRSVLDRATMET